jgi:hypothetical protein
MLGLLVMALLEQGQCDLQSVDSCGYVQMPALLVNQKEPASIGAD